MSAPTGQRLILLLGCALALGVWACGSEPTDVDVDIEIPNRTGVIGADGGRLESNGAAIDVPTGALESEVEISLGRADRAASIDGVTTLGPTIEIGPSGTTFAVPAAVTVPYVAAALPGGTTAGQIHLYTADDQGGPYAPVATTVDEANATATATVDHLSFFVPGVQTPDEPGGCTDSGTCDCSEMYADRPLDVIGTHTAEHLIDTLCFDETEDVLTLLTYEPSAQPSAPPLGYFLLTLDASTLEVVTPEQATEQESISGENCSRHTEPTVPSSPLPDGEELQWRVEVVPHRPSPGSPPDWYEIILDIESGTLRVSFNRHHNEAAPYADTNSLVGGGFDPSRASGRMFESGRARFYFYNWYESHIDVIELEDVPAMLADPDSFVDPEHPDLHRATARERVQLFDSHEYGYSYDPLVHVDGGEMEADLLITFINPQAGFQPGVTSEFNGLGLAAHRVTTGSQGLNVERLPDLGLDSFYHQLGWVNAGVDSGGVLHIASAAAQFETAMVASIDTATFELVSASELGCIGATTHAELAGGLGMLRFSYRQSDGASLVTVIEGGRVKAIADVPGADRADIWMVVGGGDGARLYLADKVSGVVSGVRLPAD